MKTWIRCRASLNSQIENKQAVAKTVLRQAEMKAAAKTHHQRRHKIWLKFTIKKW
jgi:hypothetical protein